MVEKHQAQQLALLRLLLSAGLRTTDPQLRPWIDDRVRASIQQRSACQATIELRCESCGRSQHRRSGCGPDCAACSGRSIPRARVAAQIAASMPHVATRHVVVSFPSSIVSALARGRLTTRATQGIFEQVLFKAQDLRTRARVGLTRHAKLGFGAVSIVHSFTNDLRFGPHLHALVIDGSFISEDGERRFEQNPEGLLSGQLATMAAEMAARLQRAPRHVARTSPAVIELRRAARVAPAGASKRPEHRTRASRASTASTASTVVRSRGVRIHVSEQIAAGDHHGRRRVLEYLGRSPLDPRVELRSNSRVHIELPRARRDGAEAIELCPGELARRVAALGSLAEPGAIRQHGILARRMAKRWGFEAEQLELPALGSSGRKARRAKERRATPPSDSKCRHCGGRLIPTVVEIA